jgi:hypothetical protein
MVKYEYKVCSINYREGLESQLKAWGNDGWRFHSFFRHLNGFIVFEREKVEVKNVKSKK